MKPSVFDCRQAFSRLDDFVDRELTAEEMEQVKEHLELCQTCAMEFKFESELLDAVKEKVRRVDLPPNLIEEVIEGIRSEPQL